ncbi:MAG: methyltransferase domain-containing protein [Lysobacteraceae bacterium]|nr:MAG: methyltransferase domain-containing protein [Xanthomonadaceae bacterium]
MSAKRDTMLRGLDLASASGLEIGALDKPVVPPATPRIFYVDYADTPTLRHNYRNDPNVEIGDIVQVGGIWGEQTLAEAAAPVAPVDFVVASHVIEHVPDLITWLQELGSVLKPGGQVRLAIPDKRFSFDVLRAETQYADVLTAWLVRARIPQARAVIDHIYRVTTVDCAQLWDGSVEPASLRPNNRPEHAEAIGRDVLEHGRYHDVHCWVFTPASFAGLMAELADAGYMQFKCLEFVDTERNNLEFFAALQPCADRTETVASWKAAQASVEADSPSASGRQALEQRLQQLDAELAAAALARDAAAARAAGLEQALAATRSEMDRVMASRSWRLTAPLRALLGVFRS